jgi:nitrogenase-associated protein
MTEVVFYEKPGCLTNLKQKQLLVALGHRVAVRNLLAEPWSAERLRAFFGGRPVPDWFNPTAPKVRDGLIDPAAIDAEAALAAMLADPLLIRRPLIETTAGRCAGFDDHPVLVALGVPTDPSEELTACSRLGEAQPVCPTPETA